MEKILLVMFMIFSMNVNSQILATRYLGFDLHVGEMAAPNAMALLSSVDDAFPDIMSVDWVFSFDNAVIGVNVLDIYGAGVWVEDNGLLSISQTEVVTSMDLGLPPESLIAAHMFFEFGVEGVGPGTTVLKLDSAIGKDSLGNSIDLIDIYASPFLLNGSEYTVSSVPIPASIWFFASGIGLLFHNNYLTNRTKTIR